jgi:sugar phosphate isomerase/epimerase
MTAHRLGYSLIADAFDLSDFPAALDEAEALGVDSVELPLFALHLVAGGRVVAERVARLAAVLEGRRLAVSGHGILGINLTDRADRLERHMAVAEAGIEVARRLGVGNLVIHAGRHPEAAAEEIEGAMLRQRDALRRLGDAAARAGVVLCVENVFRYAGLWTPTPGRLAAEISAVAHPNVAACLDVSHAAIACHEAGADLTAEARALIPFARHVHLHDSFGRPAGLGTFHPSEALAFGDGDLHLPLGWGGIDFDGLFDGCAFPAGATFNVELNARYWPELPDTIGRARAIVTRAGRR